MKVVSCPNGCRRCFIRLRYWDESVQPIIKQHYMGGAKPRFSGLLNCVDCHEEFFFIRITENQKKELDKLLRIVEEERVEFIRAQAEKLARTYDDFDAYYSQREAAA